MQDRKGERIVSIDLRHIPEAVCDYFVICDVSVDTQARGLANHIETSLQEKAGEKPYHVEGKDNLSWVVIDYVHVVAHIFKRDIRSYYDLEELWSDGTLESFKTV